MGNDGAKGTKSYQGVAVLVPCLNEAQTVGKVVRDFRRCLPGAQVYVYDNASEDATAAEAAAAGALVRYEPNRGKGNVVRTMLREVEADCFLLVDGDDTYPAEAAPELCGPILAGCADLVIGDRLSTTYFQENKRCFHGPGNMLVSSVVKWLWQEVPRQGLDVMTGYRALSAACAKSFPALSHGFEIETEMTLYVLANHLRMQSVPVEYRDRPAGSCSKLHTLRDGIIVLGTIAGGAAEHWNVCLDKWRRKLMTKLKRVLLLCTMLLMLGLPLAQAFPVTSPFGWRIHPITGEWAFHAGVDLGYEYGAGIVALFDGEVIMSGNFGDGYGNQVLLYHPAIDAYTRYAHCSAVYVSPGQQVASGEVIAAVGSTGNTTGPHLHLEYMPRSGDQYIYTDPLTLWQ